jgi:hypothetical protein
MPDRQPSGTSVARRKSPSILIQQHHRRSTRCQTNMRNQLAMAMNGWADDDPARWLNLQAHPEASVELADGRHTVRARAADGAEPSRLWDRWRDLDTKLDDYAALRSGETALVILEPRPPKRSAAAEPHLMPTWMISRAIAPRERSAMSFGYHRFPPRS